MKFITAAALLLVLMAAGVYATWNSAAPAASAAETSRGADLVYRQGGYSVRLLETPCGFTEMQEALQADGGMGDAKGMVVTDGPRRFSGCWARSVDEVLLQDMSGRGGALPLSWFKREPVL